MTSIRVAALSAALVVTAAMFERPVVAHRVTRIVLVGDSTVTTDKGWGRGFCALLDAQVECINKAASGRSSRSYIDEGRWREALALKGTFYLIQFGHNDEPGKGPERETDPATTYRQYLSRYIDEARVIGATPVLITPLTRRKFDEAGHIVPNLVPYAEAVTALASEKHVPIIDLHARSTDAAERLGESAWAALSPRDDTGRVDRTHLNGGGSTLVGAIVAAELSIAVPALASHLQRQALPIELAANAVVAADGSAPYKTVQDAINAAPQNTSPSKRWIIYIKAGRYREIVYLQREKRFVMLVGADPATTTITFDLHANMTGLDGKPIGTFRTPTLTVDADDFSVENLTVENTAGPVGQALALRVDGDRAVFRNCRFLGWQDTIFLNRGRQYFEDVYVEGHVDFIFGGATAFFERPRVHVLRGGYITAASTPSAEPFGFVFARGAITGEPGARTYLGRPWRGHAQTTFIDMTMSEVVRSEGWHNWDKPEREKTARYAETGSTGPGANPRARVAWARQLTPAEARAITVGTVLGGADKWDPKQVPAHPVRAPLVLLTPTPGGFPLSFEERRRNRRSASPMLGAAVFRKVLLSGLRELHVKHPNENPPQRGQKTNGGTVARQRHRSDAT